MDTSTFIPYISSWNLDPHFNSILKILIVTSRNFHSFLLTEHNINEKGKNSARYLLKISVMSRDQCLWCNIASSSTRDSTHAHVPDLLAKFNSTHAHVPDLLAKFDFKHARSVTCKVFWPKMLRFLHRLTQSLARFACKI